MAIDATVIMWVFGLVFVCFTSLVAVIWRMLIWRIAAVEAAAEKDRENQSKVLTRIFDKLDGMEKEQHRMHVDLLGRAINQLQQDKEE